MSELTWSDQEKAQLRADALRLIIPHFASNAELAGGPKIFVRGEGCYVWDAEGNKMLDAFAGLWCVNIGYGRKELGRAAAQQLERLA